MGGTRGMDFSTPPAPSFVQEPAGGCRRPQGSIPVMIVGRHIHDGSILVMATDRGLPVFLLRDAAGAWSEARVTPLEMMTEFVEVDDAAAAEGWLGQALDAWREDIGVAADAAV